MAAAEADAPNQRLRRLIETCIRDIAAARDCTVPQLHAWHMAQTLSLWSLKSSAALARDSEWYFLRQYKPSLDALPYTLFGQLSFREFYEGNRALIILNFVRSKDASGLNALFTQLRLSAGGADGEITAAYPKLYGLHSLWAHSASNEWHREHTLGSLEGFMGALFPSIDLTRWRPPSVDPEEVMLTILVACAPGAEGRGGRATDVKPKGCQKALHELKRAHPEVYDQNRILRVCERAIAHCHRELCDNRRSD